MGRGEGQLGAVLWLRKSQITAPLCCVLIAASYTPTSPLVKRSSKTPCPVVMPKRDLALVGGDWVNIQEIIKETFVLTLKQLEKQNESIAKLGRTIKTLEAELVTRPRKDDIDRLVESRCRHHQSQQCVDDKGLDKLKSKVSNIKIEVKQPSSYASSHRHRHLIVILKHSS